MSDVVRDLVVSLSLDAGEFTRNMRAINASIKEAESSFRLAGAGVAKFESSLSGQMARAEMLMQTQMLQSAAVKQYAAHLSEANAKMVATEGYLAKYSARLAEAKAQMAPLNAEIARQHAEVERTAAVYASVDAAYQQNINSINSLQQSMVSLEQEIAATEMMYEHSFSTLGAGDSQTEAYRARLASLNAELSKQRSQMASLQAMTKTLATARASAASQASRAAQAEQTLLQRKAALEAEITKLTGQVREETQALENNRTAVVRAQTELNNAKARLRETEAELRNLQKQIALMSSMWTQAGAALTAFSQKCVTLGRTMQRTGRMMLRYLTTPIVGAATASVKALISYDKAFANVRRTVSATEEQFTEFYSEIEQMSTVVATSADDIAEVVATAGQLGIHTENIMDFTRAMIDLSVASTDLEANEAATQLAKFANITGMSHDQFTNLSSAIVALGINYATTESEIVEMSKRLAAAGKQVGLSEAQIVGFAAALSSVGLEAQMGGSTFSKALVKMEVAAATGGQALTDFAKVCGLTEDEFKRMWAADPAEVFQRFIVGLAQLGDEGASAIATLQEIGISEIRLRDTLLRATNATELFAATQKTAIDAWNENTMLADSAAKKYDTLAAKLTNLKNRALVAGRQIGRDLTPTIESLMEKANNLITSFMGLDKSQRESILKWAAIAAALGPVILITGTLIKNIGYIAGAVGKLFTAFGKLSAAITMAGGGFRGLLSVIGHSKVAMLALTAAAVYGAVSLYDYASGAKAAREALKQLNDTAEDWKNNQASTFYSESKGLEAFGLAAEDFTKDIQSTKSWLQSLTDEWSDNTIEAKGTVESYVESFKRLTGATRDTLSGMADTASEAGFTNLNSQIRADMAELNVLDTRVEELLTKRREYFLTDEDIAELNSLLLKREEIEIKYRISEADTDGFSQLEAGMDAAIARAEAQGKEVGVDVYKDALLAGAEGMQAVNKALDEQYDSRYALVQLITDEAEKEAAMAQLNEWYNNERLEAGREYARVMGRAITPVLNSEGIQKTYGQMSELVTLLSQYSRGEKSVVDLNDFIAGLDESSIAEFYGLVTQIQSLRDQGLSYDEISTLTGVDVSFLETAYTQLEQINTLLQGMNTDKNLDPLRTMFGDALSEEVLKIATDLDMTGAKEAWAAFAADPGADVFTDAIIEGYKEKEGGADKSSIDNPGGFYALVAGYRKDPEGFSSAFDAPSELTALVVAYAKDPDTFSSYFTAPGGLSALVTQYQKDPENFVSTFEGPAELLAYVAAYAKDPSAFNAAFNDPTGLTAYVTGYGKAATFSSLFEDPSGLTAYVKMYAKDPNFKSFFENPTGLIALVSMYAKDPNGFSDAFASPEGLKAYVAQYAKDPEFSAYFDGPSGLNALVKAYEADPENFNTFFKSPSGLVALVSAYQQDPEGFNAFFANPNGLIALVSAYAEDPETFNAAFADPSGLHAMVEGYIADPENFVSTFDGPSGLLALVKAYAEISGGANTAGLTPSVTATVTLSDIDASALKTWKAVNGPKVKLTTSVGLKASVSLGEGWEAALKEKYDAGLLAVYGADGMPLKVSPKVLKQLTADSLIVGVDESGVYHVMVKPQWANATDEDLEDFNDGFKPDTDVYQKLTSKWDKYRSWQAQGGKMHWFGDSDTGFIGALNDAADWVGGAINDVQDFFTKDLTPHEITEFAEATAMLTSAVNEGTNSYSAYGDEAVQFLNDMADATEAANASGKNMELVNRTLAELAAVGINIKATDLPEYLRSMAKGAQYGTTNLSSMTNRLTQMNKEVTEAREESADYTALIAEQGQHLSWGDYARQAAELRALTRELTAEEKAYLDAFTSYQQARNEAAAYDSRINGSRFSKDTAQGTAETNTEKALRNASKYRQLNEQLEQGAIDYETYVSKANALMESTDLSAWDNYYKDMRKYVDVLKEYGIEVPEVYERFIAAYTDFQGEYSGMRGYVANGFSPMYVEKASMDQALEFLADYARLSEKLGSSEKALQEMSADEGANVVDIYINQYLALWKKKKAELDAIIGEGGVLNTEQQEFMAEYQTLMSFFGEDFLADVDLSANGGEIGGSLGEGIESRLKGYDFTGTGSAVADSLDAAVRNPLGAHSPATRFIPIGMSIAEGLAAGIRAGT
ncbi:MAG: phage tail tape measure protein, partial [Clostridia bacterium]|nr:phage tail tape measure protein [Clostridia bacterium]